MGSGSAPGRQAKNLRCTKANLRDGLGLSICCTYNCRSLSRDELIDHLFRKVRGTSCDILSVCETRERMKWRRPGKKDRGFWKGSDFSSAKNNLFQSQFRSAFLPARFQGNLQGRSSLCPTTASDDDEVEKFSDELELISTVKST